MVIFHPKDPSAQEPVTLGFHMPPLPSGQRAPVIQLLSLSVIQIEQKKFPGGIKMHTWVALASSSLERSRSRGDGGGEAWNESRLIRHVSEVWIIHFLTLYRALSTAGCYSLFGGTLVTQVSQPPFRAMPCPLVFSKGIANIGLWCRSESGSCLLGARRYGPA